MGAVDMPLGMITPLPVQRPAKRRKRRQDRIRENAQKLVQHLIGP